MPYKTINKIEYRLKIILGAAIFCLVLLAYISYSTLHSFKLKNEWVSHSTEVMYNIESLGAEILKATTLQRAFLLTNDNDYRKPFVDSKIDIAKYYNRIKELTEDNDTQQKRLIKLQSQLEVYYDLMGYNAKLIPDSTTNINDLSGAIKKVQVSIFEIKSTLSLMQEMEESLKILRSNEVNNSLEKNYLVISIFSLLTLIIIILAYLNFRKEIEVRSKLELQLKQSVHQLSQSNQELEQFAYVASHDLQEPLRKVISFSDIILRKYADNLDEKAKGYFGRMVASTTRMQLLIQDLLNFSRTTRNVGDKTNIKINPTIKEVVEELSVGIKEINATVKLKLIDDPIIVGNEVQIRQLFQNIITNAIKYKKLDTAPIVKIKSKIVDNSVMKNKIAIITHEKYLRIAITDNGIGFDEQYLDKVFTIFQRLHGRSEYSGTGIGLALTKRVVENHNGYITAKSTEGKGSTFIVYLPIENIE